MENINKKLPGLGFHHIALKVKDFEKSLDFYVNGLGCTPTVGWLNGEGKKIQMLDLGNGDIIEMFEGGDDSLQPVGNWQHFAMCVDDVDAAYEAAVAYGARPKIAPKTVPLDSKPYKMAIHIAFVYGPDDEELEFFTVESKEEK